jgi:hypothetical protein
MALEVLFSGDDTVVSVNWNPRGLSSLQLLSADYGAQIAKSGFVHYQFPSTYHSTWHTQKALSTFIEIQNR